jgi:hypothetical protein
MWVDLRRRAAGKGGVDLRRRAARQGEVDLQRRRGAGQGVLNLRQRGAGQGGVDPRRRPARQGEEEGSGVGRGKEGLARGGSVVRGRRRPAAAASCEGGDGAGDFFLLVDRSVGQVRCLKCPYNGLIWLILHRIEVS